MSYILVKKPALLPGSGAPEMEVAVKLRGSRFLKTGLFNKKKAYLVAYADAMELIPYTLAENAGLSLIETVTVLHRQHVNGNKDFGINVRKGAVTNIKEENVLQPLLVTSFAIKQASETIRSILKIDDIKNSDSAIGYEMFKILQFFKLFHEFISLSETPAS
uniref:Uncharacterized protein n=1 Tax=Panagrolaimus superbus TaxID=310955 RepID=A0A914Z3E8_9BILA